MTQKANDSYLVNAGGCFIYAAQIVLADGYADQASINAITRRVVNTRTGQASETTLSVSEVIFDEMQTDALVWDQQFNMKDVLPADAITERCRHTLQYTLTGADGHTYKTREIDLIGD